MVTHWHQIDSTIAQLRLTQRPIRFRYICRCAFDWIRITSNSKSSYIIHTNNKINHYDKCHLGLRTVCSGIAEQFVVPNSSCASLAHRRDRNRTTEHMPVAPDLANMAVGRQSRLARRLDFGSDLSCSLVLL